MFLRVSTPVTSRSSRRTCCRGPGGRGAWPRPMRRSVSSLRITSISAADGRPARPRHAICARRGAQRSRRPGGGAVRSSADISPAERRGICDSGSAAMRRQSIAAAIRALGDREFKFTAATDQLARDGHVIIGERNAARRLSAQPDHPLAARPTIRSRAATPAT